MSSSGRYADKPTYKEVTTEEEALYHERTTEPNPKNYTTTSREITPVAHTTTSKYHHDHNQSSGDDDNFSEWTTSKKKVHHKTRQVETRVSRQLLVEDGKVIADSGPQVVTRIKEDNKVEECEKERAPKNRSKFEALENAPEGSSSSGRVLGEKKEIQRVSREIREENMQYHDERYKELTGRDMHQRAIEAPHELITINDQPNSEKPRGKMVHYLKKGKKYEDTNEILEVAKLAIDGSITKEVTRKKHHQEFSEDEKPDEKGESEALRHKPEVVRSNRRGVDYVNDFDDDADQGHHETSSTKRRGHRQHNHHHHHDSGEDEAFPRYKIDPLLNSLRDEDFKPATGSRGHSESYSVPHNGGGGGRKHKLERKNESSSSDDDNESSLRYSRTNPRPSSPQQHQFKPVSHDAATVEIPEVYRNHRERLLSSKGKGPRDRSFSPANKSHLSHRSSKSHRSQKEDASVQARLTDEEEERKSLRSSSSSAGGGGAKTQAKATKQLQRQSTVNSHRNYYYGKPQGQRSRSVQSLSSSSSSSLDDPRDRLRKNGARSKDSGFKSPMRPETPISQQVDPGHQQIYSVSSKQQSKRNRDCDPSPASPTPSAGQRSVKTTTTTMSAGLTDRRPPARGERSTLGPRQAPGKPTTTADRREGGGPKMIKRGGSSSCQNDVDDDDDDDYDYGYICDHYKYKVQETKRRDKKVGLRMLQHDKNQSAVRPARLLADKDVQCSMDEAISSAGSLDSSMPAVATTIKVPYREPIERTQMPVVSRIEVDKAAAAADEEMVKEAGGEMRLEEDIAKLRQRLANIDSRTKTLASSRRKSNQDGQQQQVSEPPKEQHFDYKTIVANVKPVAGDGYHKHHQQQHTIQAYNVRVIEHDSPFRQQSGSASELSNSIAQLSSVCGSSSSGVGGSTSTNNNKDNITATPMDNNNEANFNLDNFVKHRAIPIMTQGSKGSRHSPDGSMLDDCLSDGDDDDDDDDDDDRVSIMSSCSLRSSRTYHIRYANGPAKQGDRDDDDNDDDDLNDEKHFPVGRINLNNHDDDDGEMMDDERKPAAWIYNIRDGSSTTIVAPPKPEGPKPPKVDAKELALSRGGRSYYLELIDNAKEDNNGIGSKDMGPNNNALYSRWSSQGALSQAQQIANLNPRSPQHQKPIINSPPIVKPAEPISAPGPAGSGRKSRQILPASIIYQNDRPRPARPQSSSNTSQQQQQQQQQSISGKLEPFGNQRSKSISCLASSTRPTKYSIYGGLRKSNGANKPVPRLSYSRAIGPKSQRQIDAQSKVPSRYLKMK